MPTLLNPYTYPIRPADIVPTMLDGLYEDPDPIDGIKLLAQFCRNRNRGWSPFTRGDLLSYLNSTGQTGGIDAMFTYLYVHQLLEVKRNSWSFTHELVSLMFLQSEKLGTINPFNYPILPVHIDTTQPFAGIFGRAEYESAARILVQFCQVRDEGWKPFTPEGLDAYLVETGQHTREDLDYAFNHFAGKDLIEVGAHASLFSHNFIAAIFHRSPKL